MALRRPARSSALRRPLTSLGSVPSEKTARSRAAATKTLNRGPHNWTSDGSSHVEGSVPATRVDRQQRGPGHAVLQPRPGCTPKRVLPAWQPHIEPTGVPPERQNLRPCQVEPNSGHLTSALATIVMLTRAAR